MKILEGNLSLQNDEKILIINARFNDMVTNRLVEGAKDAFIRHGGKEENLSLMLVPGAFEIPLALEKALSSGKWDGIVCVGAVIRGSTPHFDYVSAEVSKGVANTALKYAKPVTFGVLTTDTIEQAMDRAGLKAGNKGFEAMTGVIELISLFNKL